MPLRETRRLAMSARVVAGNGFNSTSGISNGASTRYSMSTASCCSDASRRSTKMMLLPERRQSPLFTRNAGPRESFSRRTTTPRFRNNLSINLIKDSSLNFICFLRPVQSGRNNRKPFGYYSNRAIIQAESPKNDDQYHLDKSLHSRWLWAIAAGGPLTSAGNVRFDFSSA